MTHPKSWDDHSLIYTASLPEKIVNIKSSCHLRCNIHIYYRLKERSLWMRLAQLNPTDSGPPCNMMTATPDYCNHKQCDVHAFAFALTHLSAQPTSSSTPTWPTQPSPAQPACLPKQIQVRVCLPAFFFQKLLASLSFFQSSACRSWMPSIHTSARPAPTRLTSSGFHQVTLS